MVGLCDVTQVRFMNFLIIVARGVCLWLALGRDYPRGSRESFGHSLLPPFFLPFTPACLIAVTESLCMGRMRMVFYQVRRQILPGIPTRSAEGVCVECGCHSLVRRRISGETDVPSVSQRARFHGVLESNPDLNLG